MVIDIEQWKSEIQKNYNIFMYGNDDDGSCAMKFCRLVHSANGELTEDMADFLFSLFCDKEDYEVMESVVGQLWGMTDKKIFAKSLLKAFPNLTKNASRWAEDFLYGLAIRNKDICSFIIEEKDNIGKKAMLDYINKMRSEGNESSDTKNMSAFKQLARCIQDSQNND